MGSLDLQSPHVARVLSIAGTDPTGGAGTAADLKSITAAGGYAMAVYTCLVAQNTQGVRSVHTPPVEFLAEQLQAVRDDVELDAVKTGMLGTAEIIATVSTWLDENPAKVLVVDPVMVATSGDRLLDETAENAMREFCKRATVITPNIPELAVLLQESPAADEATALDQARRWAQANGNAVIVKTGHLDVPVMTCTWVGPDGAEYAASSPRVETRNTHGTGCSLSSALAARLGRGDEPAAALAWVVDWLYESIRFGAALQVGKGHGPIDHGHRARRLSSAALTTPWQPQLAQCLDVPEELAPAASAPRPTIAAAGPWTAALWRASGTLAEQVYASDFVTRLGSGELPNQHFVDYLSQDNLYLERYSRALAALGLNAPNSDDLLFWTAGSAACIAMEREMQQGYLADRRDVAMSPVTSAYVNHLLVSTTLDDYVVGVAAVLPCYWLYAEVGHQFPNVPDDHPYAPWLGAYESSEFDDAVRQAIGIVERAMAEASPAARARAALAYLLACRHELEFFDQALRLEAGA